MSISIAYLNNLKQFVIKDVFVICCYFSPLRGSKLFLCNRKFVITEFIISVKYYKYLLSLLGTPQTLLYQRFRYNPVSTNVFYCNGPLPNYNHR